MSDDLAAYLSWAQTQPAARPPATFGEIWRAEWDRASLDLALGISRFRHDVLDEASRAAETATGRSMDDLATERGRGRDAADFGVRKWIVQDLAQSGDEATKKALAPYADLDAAMRKRAARLEGEAERVAGASYGLSGWATGVLAGMARQAVDPLTLASMAIPGGGGARAAMAAGGKGVAGFVAREAGQAAAGQALQEPFVQPGREALGLDHGFGRAASNIAGAAAVGGVFGASRIGAAALFDRAALALRGASHGPDGLPVEPSLRPLAEVASADDLAAAARAAERDAVFHAPADVAPERLVAHGDALEAAARGMETRSFDVEAWMAARAAFEAPAPVEKAPRLGKRALAEQKLEEADALLRGALAETAPDAQAARWREGLDALDAASRETSPTLRETVDAERAGRIEARARAAAPDVFAEADRLDALIASQRFAARTAMQTAGDGQAVRPVALDARVADLEARLAAFTGKRRASPSARAVAEALEAAKAERDGVIAADAARARGTEQAARMALVEATQKRAALGPQIAAARRQAEETIRPRPASEALRAVAPLADALDALAARGDQAARPLHPLVAAIGDAARAADAAARAGKPATALDGEAGAALRLFYEDDGLRVPSSTMAVRARIEAALDAARAAAWRNDLFGEGWTPAAILDRARREGRDLESLDPAPRRKPGAEPRPDAATPPPDAPAATPEPAPAPARLARPEGAPDLTAARADIERALASRGDLDPLEWTRPDGSVERVAPADLLARADRLRQGAAELAACIAGAAA